MAVRFLILFAVTNSLALASFSAFLAGGAAATALGLVLALPALAGFVVTGRVVVLARPSRISETAAELRRLRRLARETVR